MQQTLKIEKKIIVGGKETVVFKIIDIDLEPPKSTNKLEEFENSLPFSKCFITQFCEHVNRAEDAHGGHGIVTLKNLREEFTSPAWESLHDDNSTIVKLLNSSAFKNPKLNNTGLHYCADSLILWGILLCQGKALDKARTLYNVLQDGGPEANPQIAACDKDYPVVIKKMCELATKDVFVEFLKLAGQETKYTEKDIERIDKDCFEYIREECFLEDVYNFHSRLEFDEWLHLVIEKAPYMLTATSLRKKVLESCGLEMKYAKTSILAIPSVVNTKK